MDDSLDIFYRAALEKALGFLKKSDCKQTRKRIARIIGCSEEEPISSNEIQEFPAEIIFRIKAEEYLKKKETAAEIKTNPDYKDYLNDFENLRDSLKKTVELMQNDSIIDLLQSMAERNDEVPLEVALAAYDRVYNNIRTLELQLATIPIVGKKGRPPLTDLYNYVSSLAKFYTDIIGEDFAINRHISETSKKCEPITNAHDFISVMVSCINECLKTQGHNIFYTDKNIYTTFEKVQKHLSSANK